MPDQLVPDPTPGAKPENSPRNLEGTYTLQPFANFDNIKTTEQLIIEIEAAVISLLEGLERSEVIALGNSYIRDGDRISVNVDGRILEIKMPIEKKIAASIAYDCFGIHPGIWFDNPLPETCQYLNNVILSTNREEGERITSVSNIKISLVKKSTSTGRTSLNFKLTFDGRSPGYKDLKGNFKLKLSFPLTNVAPQFPVWIGGLALTKDSKERLAKARASSIVNPSDTRGTFRIPRNSTREG